PTSRPPRWPPRPRRWPRPLPGSRAPARARARRCARAARTAPNSPRRARRWRSAQPVRSRCDPSRRQVYGEGGALAWLTVDRDAAAVLADDAVAHREAESDVGPVVLGGEEGLEDFLAQLGRDSLAGVAHRNRHTAFVW